MKKLIGTLIIAVYCLLPAQAQEAKTLFVNMPDSLSPLLTAVNRADFVDFLESKMKAEVDNRFGGKSEMTALGTDYICIQMTPQTTWQMKLLPVNDSTQVICIVATACAPACDSNIRFYTTSWQELPASGYLRLPAMDDFFVVPADSAQLSEYNDLRPKADMLLAKADLSKDNRQLAFTFTTTSYMGEDSAEKLKQYLRKPLVYEWEEGTQRFISSTR